VQFRINNGLLPLQLPSVLLQLPERLRLVGVKGHDLFKFIRLVNLKLLAFGASVLEWCENLTVKLALANILEAEAGDMVRLGSNPD
jgi:hypothetical protein